LASQKPSSDNSAAASAMVLLMQFLLAVKFNLQRFQAGAHKGRYHRVDGQKCENERQAHDAKYGFKVIYN